MKVIQILTNLTKGDAISNDVLAIDEELCEAGYETAIMTLKVHEDLESEVVAFDLESFSTSDIVIFHKSTGDALTKRVSQLFCKKGVIYHNITPARFFLPYDPVMAGVLMAGRHQLKKHIRKFDFAWGDSEYNCKELREIGAKNIEVLPVLLKQNRIIPDEETLEELKNHNGTKLLFIGRISPNKKYEDIIKVYWHVLQQDPNAKLFLIGRWDGLEKYYAKLKGFCANLHLSDSQVVFTGSVSEEKKKAYLTGTDVLVCMSEHEGFCIPLVESMAHDLPVVAYAAAAIPETLGESHELLYREKNYSIIADAILRLKMDEAFRQRIIASQHEQLRKFNSKKTQEKLLSLIRRVTDE